MDFLNFYAERLSVSTREARELLERTLNNYRPARDYSIRVLELARSDDELCSSQSATAYEAWGSAPEASGALAANRSSHPNCAPIPRVGHTYLEQ